MIPHYAGSNFLVPEIIDWCDLIKVSLPGTNLISKQAVIHILGE